MQRPVCIWIAALAGTAKVRAGETVRTEAATDGCNVTENAGVSPRTLSSSPALELCAAKVKQEEGVPPAPSGDPPDAASPAAAAASIPFALVESAMGNKAPGLAWSNVKIENITPASPPTRAAPPPLPGTAAIPASAPTFTSLDSPSPNYPGSHAQTVARAEAVHLAALQEAAHVQQKLHHVQQKLQQKAARQHALRQQQEQHRQQQQQQHAAVIAQQAMYGLGAVPTSAAHSQAVRV